MQHVVQPRCCQKSACSSTSTLWVMRSAALWCTRVGSQVAHDGACNSMGLVLMSVQMMYTPGTAGPPFRTPSGWA
jgi:hypothetical protein